MTVAELIAELQKLPQDSKVLMLDRDGFFIPPDPTLYPDGDVVL